MTSWERATIWNRNRAKNATFKFVSDDSDADIWLVDNDTGERQLLTVEEIRVLDLIFRKSVKN